MVVETLDRFAALVYQGEETEAYEINRHYDELVNEGFAGNILEHAVRRAHERLAQDRYGGDAFGYQIVRDARLWWEYRNAYFNDRLVDELRVSELYDRAETHAIEQEYIDGQLQNLSNPIYFLLYSQLETYRNRHARNGELVDPFDLERKYSLAILMNVMDESVEAPTATTHPDGSKSNRFALTAPDETLDFWISRAYDPVRREVSYSLEGYLPLKPDNNGGGPEKFMRCAVNESPAGLESSCKYLIRGQKGENIEQVELTGLQLLDMADDLSVSKRFALRRPNSPIPELAEQRGQA